MAKRTLLTFSILIAVLTLVSCSISIINNGIYQDGAWANAQWLGQDMVTLLLALPFLLISLSRGVQNSNWKWTLVHSGILLYFTYTYSFYMFAAELSFLYLLQVPIFGLAVIGMVISLIEIFKHDRVCSFKGRGLKITIIAYLLLISILIASLWIKDLVSHLADPNHLSDTPDGKAPLIIYSLDLALIIPLMLASAVLMAKNKTLGYILGGIILTKTSTLGFALMAMALSLYIQNLDPDYFLIILWSIIGVAGTILTLSYMKKLSVSDTDHHSHEN